jgi:hypothetical protein
LLFLKLAQSRHTSAILGQHDAFIAYPNSTMEILMKKFLAATALIALLTSGAAGVAHAQTSDTTIPGHPRVNEVDQRLENQQNRIDNGVKDGQINAKQEMRDEKTDAKVSQELSADQAKNGGHITKAEQRKMNKQLNGNSKRIHRQRTKGVTTTPAAATVPAAQ